MELSIKDRLYIPGFLPKENNFKQFNIKEGDSEEKSKFQKKSVQL